MADFACNWRRLCSAATPAGLLVILAVFVALSGGCSRSDAGGEDNPLYVDPATKDFSDNPELLQRILASPHGYFRFINIPFSKEICRRFNRMLLGTPSFNLHGDAHIEQYAMTDLGRGLTDFDDSSTGPAIIDLLRFGVSLRLACRANGWTDQADTLYETFLRGYRQALNDPHLEAPVPSLVARVKKTFKFDRVKYFDWVDSIIGPMSESEIEALIAAMKPYFENMRLEEKDLPADFFAVVRVGSLKLGIGSAQDIKYLVRVQGKTPNPYDDIVLEVKQVRDLTAIDCITVAQSSDPFRVLVGQARIAYEPYHLLGYIRFKQISFWVHSWVDNYKEVRIEESFASVRELGEVAYDVGVQLGRGHTNQIAAPLDVQLRREQLRLLAKYESQIKKACVDLTILTVNAWQTFANHLQTVPQTAARQ